MISLRDDIMDSMEFWINTKELYTDIKMIAYCDGRINSLKDVLSKIDSPYYK